MTENEKKYYIKIIDSLIFASEVPLLIKSIADIISISNESLVLELVQTLKEHYDMEENHGIKVIEVANGFQFRTKEENSTWLKKLSTLKPYKLSRAAMDTLAIVAYKQPITRAEVEYIRGVDSSGVVKLLLEKGLVKMIGKKREAGRPMLYGTAERFLEYLGINSLSDLPQIGEISEGEGEKTSSDSDS
mgnify:CR=1 FL=1